MSLSDLWGDPATAAPLPVTPPKPAPVFSATELACARLSDSSIDGREFDGYMHPSEIGRGGVSGFCELRYGLSWREWQKGTRFIKPKYAGVALGTTFGIGHGIHWWLQNDLFAPLILGIWQCTECGHRTDDSVLSPRPDKCSHCVNTQNFEYHEAESYYPDGNMRGKMDAVFAFPDGNFGVYFVGVDFKTISPKSFATLTAPLRENIDQVCAYMLGRPDIREFRIMYVCKGYTAVKSKTVTPVLNTDGFNSGPFKEFIITRDHPRMQVVAERTQRVWGATEAGALGALSTSCKTRKQADANGCPFADGCFGPA